MYHMLAVERSKIGFSEADAGRSPEPESRWNHLLPPCAEVSTLVRAAWQDGLDARGKPRTWTRNRTTKDYTWTWIHKVTLTCCKVCYFCYHVLSNFVQFTMPNQQSCQVWFSVSLFWHSQPEAGGLQSSRGMPRPKHMRFLSSRVSYWVLLFSASLSRTDCCCAARTAASEKSFMQTPGSTLHRNQDPLHQTTEALATRVSTIPPSRTLDQNFLSTFWSSSQRCLLLRIWTSDDNLHQESPNSRHPTASSNIPTCPTCTTCPTCIGPASLKQVLPAWTLMSHPPLCCQQA